MENRLLLPLRRSEAENPSKFHGATFAGWIAHRFSKAANAASCLSACIAATATRNEKRRSLFEAQDQVDRRRDELIAAIEGKLIQDRAIHPLFTIRWILGS